MNYQRILSLNDMLEHMKREFFSVNTPATASNEIASIYHFLPLEISEINELQSNDLIALESRFAIMNKHREFVSLIKIGKTVFIENNSNTFYSDLDYSNSNTRMCLNFLVDCCYSSVNYDLCILFGEKLLSELNRQSNILDTVNRKNLLMALSMAYLKKNQFDRSDYYRYLVDKNE